MKDKEKQFRERINCGQATIIEEIEITEEAVRKNEDNAGAFVDLLNQEIEAMKYFANKNAVSILDIVNTCGKEKQIEEMANDICSKTPTQCVSMSGRCKCLINEKALEKLYNAGYRKLPKDSVVLSREEYNETLEQFRQEIIALSQELVNSRKETVEKFAKRLIEIFSTAKGVCSGCALQHDKAKNPTAREFQFGKYKGFEVAKHEVKELAKQFGVEIKE